MQMGGKIISEYILKQYHIVEVSVKQNSFKKLRVEEYSFSLLRTFDTTCLG